jgi:hypothetical protein
LAVWAEAHGWIYEMFPLDTPSETLGRFQTFKELWDSKRKSGTLPAWRDFELNDLDPSWYGWLCVEDVIPGDEFNSKIRLWGTNLTQLWGIDLTGKELRDHRGLVFSDEDFDMSQEMLQGNTFRLLSGPLDWQHDYRFSPFNHITVIQLPLADDGKTVDRLITLDQPIQKEDISPCQPAHVG